MGIGPVLRGPGVTNSVAFGPNGKFAITAYDDGAQIWDVEEGIAVGQPLEHRIAVRAVAISPYGDTVVTAGPDHTVISYLSESVFTFQRGALVASSVMLGIAAERAFIMLAESVRDALSNDKERKQLSRILEGYQMKPMLEWVRKKLEGVKTSQIDGFPDDVGIAVEAVYNLLRVQRNEFGHPKALPPSIERGEALVRLAIFPTYYERVEQVRACLRTNTI